MRKEGFQGLISAAINEDGDVVEAQVVQASSQEAGKFLADRVKSMKFEPRPGCGLFKTQFNFSLAG